MPRKPIIISDEPEIDITKMEQRAKEVRREKVKKFLAAMLAARRAKRYRELSEDEKDTMEFRKANYKTKPIWYSKITEEVYEREGTDKIGKWLGYLQRGKTENIIVSPEEYKKNKEQEAVGAGAGVTAPAKVTEERLAEFGLTKKGELRKEVKEELLSGMSFNPFAPRGTERTFRGLDMDDLLLIAAAKGEKMTAEHEERVKVLRQQQEEYAKKQQESLEKKKKSVEEHRKRTADIPQGKKNAIILTVKEIKERFPEYKKSLAKYPDDQKARIYKMRKNFSLEIIKTEEQLKEEKEEAEMAALEARLKANLRKQLEADPKLMKMAVEIFSATGGK